MAHVVLLQAGDRMVAVGPFPDEDWARVWEEGNDPTALTCASEFAVLPLVRPDDWDAMDAALRMDSG